MDAAGGEDCAQRIDNIRMYKFCRKNRIFRAGGLKNSLKAPGQRKRCQKIRNFAFSLKEALIVVDQAGNDQGKISLRHVVQICPDSELE